MRRTAATVIFAIAVACAATGAAAQTAGESTEVQALRQAANGDKQELVERTLQLTPAEAKTFWPAYTAYQRALEASDRMRSVALEGVLSRDREVSNLYAKKLATDMIAADEAELKARRTLQARVLRALPARKAARYMQLESKLRALQFYDIAVQFPLIQ